MNKNKKDKKSDARTLVCVVCGTHRAIIHKYGLNMCRRCFRESAASIGFKKLS